jgi:hypothetical protein
MTLIVEDGTGKEDANSYSDLAFITAHHALRGNAAWSGATEAEQEAAAVRATDYLDGQYASRFRGRKRTQAQARQWPRIGAMDDQGFPLVAVDTVPRGVKLAHAELALRALSGPLNPDLSAADYVVSQSRGLGPISTSVTYSQSRVHEGPRYPEVEGHLAPLVVNRMSVDIVRG